MNWKEQFEKILSKHIANWIVEVSKDNQKPLRRKSRKELLNFISTEIIEKLIEDIPDKITNLSGDKFIRSNHLKQQLSPKWLERN